MSEVLELVGLADAADRKVGGYSLGMRQRLGLAYALLGDPGVLVLDEPANGLDPEGIRWMRGFLRSLAAEGRTVLVSSHLLAEVQQTVDALLIISRGRLVFQGGVDELADSDEYATVVDAPDRAALAAALEQADVPFEVLRSGLTVRGVDPAAVGAAAAAAGVALSSLHRRGPALEEIFLDLVNGARVHPSADGAAPVQPEPEPDPVAAESEPETTSEPEPEGEPEVEPEPEFVPAVAEPADREPEPEPDGEGEPSVSEAAAESPPPLDPWAPEDADPDVEAIGAIDEELLAPEPPDADDRPWESSAKTDADLEADAFFASFDHTEAAEGPEPAAGDPVRDAAELGVPAGDAASVPPSPGETDAAPGSGHHEGGDR